MGDVCATGNRPIAVFELHADGGGEVVVSNAEPDADSSTVPAISKALIIAPLDKPHGVNGRLFYSRFAHRKYEAVRRVVAVEYWLVGE